MPDPVQRKATRAAMQMDAQRAYVEMNARLYGHSPEDVAKLYDAYGPYASTLFNTAVYKPMTFRHIQNPDILNTKAFDITIATTDLFNTVQDGGTLLTNQQIARLTNKTELEVATNIAEYKKIQEERRQIDNTYQTICDGKDLSSTSIESLLAAGVTQEDFQAVFEQDETLAFNIGESPNDSAIVDAAKNKNNGKAQGNCGIGTKEVADSIRGNPTSRALYTSTPSYGIDEGVSPYGASGYHLRLAEAGTHIYLTKPNEAYIDTTGIPDEKKRAYIIAHKNDKKVQDAAKRMCEFTDKLPKGTIIVWDNHTYVDKEGKVKPIDGGNGIENGHTAWKLPDGYKCDGLQQNPHAAGWYGKYFHQCYNIDSPVPAEYAKMLIEQAQERTGQCLDVAENKKAYEAGRRASQSAQRTRSKTTPQQSQTTTNRSRRSSSSHSKSTGTTRRGHSGGR